MISNSKREGEKERKKVAESQEREGRRSGGERDCNRKPLSKLPMAPSQKSQTLRNSLQRLGIEWRQGGRERESCCCDFALAERALPRLNPEALCEIK